jgi:hypothetical protein
MSWSFAACKPGANLSAGGVAIEATFILPVSDVTKSGTSGCCSAGFQRENLLASAGLPTLVIFIQSF